MATEVILRMEATGQVYDFGLEQREQVADRIANAAAVDRSSVTLSIKQGFVTNGTEAHLPPVVLTARVTVPADTTASVIRTALKTALSPPQSGGQVLGVSLEDHVVREPGRELDGAEREERKHHR